jgi:hypothetical protein
MFSRVAQCATEEGIPDAEMWAGQNRRGWAAAPGWADAWSSAKVTHGSGSGYDPGADEAVITDAMILSQVQAMAPEAAE